MTNHLLFYIYTRYSFNVLMRANESKIFGLQINNVKEVPGWLYFFYLLNSIKCFLLLQVL